MCSTIHTAGWHQVTPWVAPKAISRISSGKPVASIQWQKLENYRVKAQHRKSQPGVLKQHDSHSRQTSKLCTQGGPTYSLAAAARPSCFGQMQH